MKNLIFVFVIAFLLTGCNSNASLSSYKPRNGDIIFQTSRSNQSLAIQRATHSPYSHMGIVYVDQGKAFVYEAIEPVVLTPLKKWINRGNDGHFVVKRLKNASEILTKDTLAAMRKEGDRMRGSHYDLYFEWTDDRIYCSELVWKIYKRTTGIEIGELQTLSEFDFTDPIVKEKLKERYGENIPQQEKVISPAAMFSSKELISVFSN